MLLRSQIHIQCRYKVGWCTPYAAEVQPTPPGRRERTLYSQRSEISRIHTTEAVGKGALHWIPTRNDTTTSHWPTRASRQILDFAGPGPDPLRVLQVKCSFSTTWRSWLNLRSIRCTLTDLCIDIGYESGTVGAL